MGAVGPAETMGTAGTTPGLTCGLNRINHSGNITCLNTFIWCIVLRSNEIIRFIRLGLSQDGAGSP